MKISRSRSARRMALSACAVAAVTAAAPAAHAKPAAAELRVQAETRALVSGQSYLTGDASIVTDTREPACGGSGAAKTVQGPSALGLLIDAAGVSRALTPLGISDEFSFGLLVCSVGGVDATEDAFWLYKVNHVSPEVGADQRSISAGDEVLWYRSNSATGRNTGDELSLGAPVRSRTFTTFEVRVTAYDAAGKATPAAGATVAYGQQAVTADAEGVATVTSGGRGRLRLRAVRGNDVPSSTEAVCVARRLTRCSPVPGKSLHGTADGDRIKGTRGPDVIRAHGGRDRIDARGGRRDVVRCGRGRDRVRIDRIDRAGPSCEIVNGRR